VNNSLFIIGVLALIGAGISAVFTTTVTKTGALGLVTTTSVQTPYSYLALPLGAAGLILLLVSLAIKE
jgi:hypothetical protein